MELKPQGDVLLQPLVRPAPESELKDNLARLIAEHAAPIIKGVIRRKLQAGGGDSASRQQAEDLYGDVVVQLLTRLQAFIADPHENSIGDFHGYVAVTTYNACHLYLRRKYPSRWRLKNRLRYTLSRAGDFALWQGDDGDLLCGFRAWLNSKQDSREGNRRLRQLTDDPEARQRAGLTAGAPQVELSDVLRAAFRFAGGPVGLDELLAVVADLLGVRDQNVTGDISVEQDFNGRAARIDGATGFATELEQRSYLRRLWDEITSLPPLQRAALLLNLRDTHEGVIVLLPLAGIANVRQIAEATGMPAEQFAALWNQLPLDDAAIAERLGVTRQQVVNLRKSARARLGRRMKMLDA